MLNQRLEDINEDTVRALITRREAESLTLDFKRELPWRDNAARHESALTFIRSQTCEAAI